MPMTTARRTHAERQRDAEDRLTQALAELIAEHGYERTTAAQIGERAGYSRAGVRDRYGSKDGLLLALHQRYERLLLGGDPGSTRPETLDDFFDRLTAFATEHPVWLKAIFIVSFESVGASDAFAPVVRRWISTLEATAARLLAVEQAAGRARQDLDPARYAPRAVEALIGAAFRFCIAAEPLDGAAFLRERVEEVRADLAP